MRRFAASIPHRQRGAVLYIALIMLVLLALLGIVGMQVAGLQERMSSNYRAVNLAFQRTEALARNAECALEDMVNRTATAGCNAVATADIRSCDTAFDPGGWASERSLAQTQSVNARLIGPCISGNSTLDMGGAVNEDPNPIYQVTAFRVDDPDNPTAQAVIDTIFRP
ncbi:pilus assembly PilX family protein [Luteimonas deserti]|uniref:Pilus assembly protein n=1 Tax=Luteimonas deserti TaxID=2752306 RepID=A0A7Z0QQA6_9GAMM|nr:PilX N-terminal domain-containing pilus assembly protein [Luteimonas deserti]NYZ62728.1 pilus assembly protein [Luteimonas deserti]